MSTSSFRYMVSTGVRHIHCICIVIKRAPFRHLRDVTEMSPKVSVLACAAAAPPPPVLMHTRR